MGKTSKNISQLRLPLLWGLLHGINDWVAGFMLATFALHGNLNDTLPMLIIYAILGFGGQLPVGMWLDSSRSFGAFTKASLSLLLLSVVAWAINPIAGIVVAGLSSSFVHVTGGAICLESGNNKVGPLGLFTAPGVLGLALGSASSSLQPFWLLLPVAAVLVIGCFLLQSKASIVFQLPQLSKPLLDHHDWIMLAILLTVSVRSLVYDIIQQVSYHWQQGLLIIGISAFLGKIIGGFLADRMGWKTWVYITLPLAFVLLQFGRDNIYMLGFGIACLQSSVPISLLLMRQSMPLYPGVSSAIVLGVGIAVAGLPMYVLNHRYFIQGWFGLAGISVSALIMVVVFFVLMRTRFRQKPASNFTAISLKG
ncbi:MAG: hypothetical protein ABIX01_17455 [Chitinophagaceae bacterium]